MASRAVADPLAPLTAFDASVRRGARLRLPADRPLGTAERIEVDPGIGDLLELRHAPSRRFLGREPVHESLMIELARPLAGAALGTLALGRVAYRAGSERLTYQATRAVGTLTLVEVSPARFTIDAALTLIDPELDVDRVGSRALVGSIVIAR
jgi:hypothetical protein